MKLGKALLTFIALCMILTACGSSQNYKDVNSNIDAHNIVLGLDHNAVFEELKEEPEQEMCVYGYEYFLKKQN